MDPNAPQLRLTLPDDWDRIPLEGGSATADAIRRVIADRLGRRDDQAALRAQQRRRLEEAVEAARSGGARQFAMSGRADRGLAFAATVAEYAPTFSLGDGPVDAASVADAFVRRAMAAEHAEGRELEPDEHWALLEASGAVVFEKGAAIVIRRDRLIDTSPDVIAPLPADDERDAPEEPHRSVAADYWITVPGERRVILLACSSALGDLAPFLLDLFDAIVEAAEWDPPRSSGIRAQVAAGR